MDAQERYKLFMQHLQEVPDPVPTELVYDTPFQLLVAVILSAQCTDKRVNLCTPELFAAFPTARALKEATFDAVFERIKSISYPRSKTHFLLGTAALLVDRFQECVPASVTDLLSLPGVGRKTAHVLASILYDQPTLAVDTHVFRVAKRMGLASSGCTTPYSVERALTTQLPLEQVTRANRWLLLHGRYVCTARKPQCTTCPVAHFCSYFQKNQHEI